MKRKLFDLAVATIIVVLVYAEIGFRGVRAWSVRGGVSR